MGGLGVNRVTESMQPGHNTDDDIRRFSEHGTIEGRAL